MIAKSYVEIFVAIRADIYKSQYMVADVVVDVIGNLIKLVYFNASSKNIERKSFY
jgi:hypothetical protein